MILVKGAINRRSQELRVVIVDDDDTNPPQLAHSATSSREQHIAGSQLAGWHCGEFGRGRSNQNRSRIFRKRRSVAWN
jgi:hypothetical protein